MTALHAILHGEKRQEVLTPPEILDPLRDWWGGIALDPFGSSQHTIADHTILLPDDGQSFDWPDRTFLNPPYKYLQRALVGQKPPAPMFLAHPAGIRRRWCLLGPIRSHRAWWQLAHQTPWIETVALLGLRFVGYKSAFPAPLCLMFTGCPNRDELRERFGHLGCLL